MNVLDPRAPPLKSRVAYAAKVLAEGRAMNRAFDDCFEWGDGAEVVAALRKLAMSDPRIAANLGRYITR
jgi:hypothetical protein